MRWKFHRATQIGGAWLERSGRIVVAAIASGDRARTQFAILRRLVKHDPADTIALRRQVAQHLIRTGKYVL